MTSKETTTQVINHLLFKWLDAFNKGNAKAAELRFTAYYHALVGQGQQAGPLLRYIELRLRQNQELNTDAGKLAEDLIQKLFTNHYHHVTLDRPEAAKRVRSLAPELTLVSLGDLYQRQSKNWSNDIVHWTDESMRFPDTGCEQPEPCHQEAVGINLKWFLLRKDAEDLLKRVILPEEPMDEEIDGFAADNEQDENTDLPEDDEDDKEDRVSLRKALKQRIKLLKTLLDTEGEEAADAETGVVGGSRFADGMWDVISASSKVRIPMVALLYWQSRNLVIDIIRKPGGEETNCDTTGDEDETEASSPDWYDDIHDVRIREAAEKAESDAEKIILWSDIEPLLYQPVAAAEQALKEARMPSERSRTAKALAKQQALFDFNCTVFSLWYEGGSRQTIAEQLGTTEDKVRTRMEHIVRLLAPCLLALLEEQGN
ncbi:MAG: hypothetical protein ACXWT1_04130 [Methylobacter sp.]